MAVANDPAKLDELWKRVDYNGNGIVSLAEFDKLVVRAAAGGVCEGAAGGVRGGQRARRRRRRRWRRFRR